MRLSFIIAGICVLSVARLSAAESTEDNRAKHKEGAVKVAQDQDELSADVQQLVAEQTIPQVIQLFTEAKNIMDEATERLDKADTGGETLAAQTQVIEIIHSATKAKQQQSGNGQSKSGSAMMDMMERMMGKADKQGKEGKEGKPGDKQGKGQGGISDTTNGGAAGGADGGKSEARRVPKAAGTAGAASLEIPEEFRKALDAYNRGLEKKAK